MPNLRTLIDYFSPLTQEISLQWADQLCILCLLKCYENALDQ